MIRRRRGPRWPAWLVAIVAISGCTSLSGVRVEHAHTGEIVVRATGPVSFDRVAESAYGDAALGRSVALLAHLPYERELDRGTVLVLPIRDRLDERLRREESSDRHFQKGLAAVDAGSYRAAADHFRQALRDAPSRIDVRYNLGLALLQAGELTEATNILETVALARPDDAESRYAFGSVLRRRRAFVRAHEEFAAAVRLDRRHARAAFARARTLEDLGKWGRAESAWRVFLEDFPEDPLTDSAQRSLEALREQRRTQAERRTPDPGADGDTAGP